MKARKRIMSKINIDRLIEANSTRSTIYTPIIEAIVNSLEAIKDSSRTDGEIEVTFFRKQQGLALVAGGEEVTAKITDIDIVDNGIGFNDENFESFNTLHSDYKLSRGGKGFGRVFYRQYFKTVHVESVYKENPQDAHYKYREFDFTSSELAENLVDTEAENDEAYTRISLRDIRTEEAHKLEIKLDTIARRIIEHLMVYFVDDSYKCPKIILRDDSNGSSVTLNDYFEKTKAIQLIGTDDFTVKGNNDIEYKFRTKVFKIFFSNFSSTINLTAHQRLVTKTPLKKYMNEFKDDFVEVEVRPKGKTVDKNYIVAAYVTGEYLDENVSSERGEFLFKKDASMFAPLSTEDIESAAMEGIAEHFDKNIKGRQQKKTQLVAAHVATEAPWLRSYVAELDPQSIAYDAKPEDINTELERIKFDKDNQTKKEIKDLINTPPEDEDSLDKAIAAITPKITELGKSDLIQHIVLRKAVLDLFGQALKWDEQGKYKKEEAVHSIIFPMRTVSDDIDYDDHNLWMMDERLSFHSYAASDIPLSRRGERPDILVLDSPILMRDSDDLNTPINVIEFKRPQREDYTKDDDPLKQVRGYVDKLRTGTIKTKDGLSISAGENTPANAYIVSDLTKKMHEFCRDAQLILDPDGEGYHGFHQSWKIYFEVVSFKKLLRNAEMRNKILFHKLGIL